MDVLLQSLGSRVAKAVTKLFSVPISDEGTWSDIATKKFDVNAKAHYALLHDDDIARAIYCKSAYEIWTHLYSPKVTITQFYGFNDNKIYVVICTNQVQVFKFILGF